MRKSYFLFSLSAAAVIVGSLITVHEARSETVPLPPDASKLALVEPPPESEPALDIPTFSIRATPDRLVIAAIGLDAPIQHLGLDAEGRMDVPDGSTPDVGWYKYGTSPGEMGSAVIDAHVYAAFKNLDRIDEDDAIEVVMSDGNVKRFVVDEIKVHRLEDVPRETLFNRAAGARLNLITCAGSWDAARDTYSHRLVVYTKLADQR